MSVLTHYLVHTQPPERQDFYEEVLELLTSFQHAESTEKLTALMNAYVDQYPSDFNEYVNEIIEDALYSIISSHGIMINNSCDKINIIFLYQIAYALYTINIAPMVQESIDIVEAMESNKDALCDIIMLHLPTYSGIDILDVQSLITDASDGLLKRIQAMATDLCSVNENMVQSALEFTDPQLDEKIRLIKALDKTTPAPLFIAERIRNNTIVVGSPFAPVLNMLKHDLREAIADNPNDAAVNVLLLVVASDIPVGQHATVAKVIIDRMFKEIGFVTKANDRINVLMMGN